MLEGKGRSTELPGRGRKAYRGPKGGKLSGLQSVPYAPGSSVSSLLNRAHWSSNTPGSYVV